MREPPLRLIMLATASSENLGGTSVVANEFKEAVYKGLAFLSTARLLRAQLASSGLPKYSSAADQLL